MSIAPIDEISMRAARINTICAPHPKPKEPRDKMPEAVIVDAARTPIGRAFKGSLAQLRPEETAAHVEEALVAGVAAFMRRRYPVVPAGPVGRPPRARHTRV